jgi:hypothetical protein
MYIRIVSMRSGYVCCSIYTRPAAAHVAIAPPHLTLLFLYALYFVFCCVHTQQQRWEKRAGCYIQKGNPISMLLFLIPSSLRPRFFRIYYIFWCCVHVKRERRRRCVCVCLKYILSVSLFSVVYIVIVGNMWKTLLVLFFSSQQQRLPHTRLF